MLFIFLGIFFLFLGIFITINTQWFKDKLVIYATEYLTQELNYPITIDAAEISYFNSIELENILLKDIYSNEMIAIKTADISFDLVTILKKDITIEKVIINSPNVHLIKNTNDGLLNLNEFIKAIQQRFKIKKKENKSGIEFHINRIEIENGLMSYNDQRKDTIKGIFDYYHFKLEKINLNASHFLFKDNVTSFDVTNLNLIEPSFKKVVHSLDATTKIGLDHIELSKLQTIIGDSKINHYIRFDFENFKAFDDFNRLVTITTSLKKATISSKDIGMFSSTVRNNINEKWIVSGDYKGKITNFKSSNFEIKFGKNSVAKGKMSFDGLPDFYNTFLDIKLSNSHIKATDLTQYFPSAASKKNLPKFGHLIANGSFIGFPLDFVAFGDFSTSLGNITSDINLKIKDGKASAYYKGKISTSRFHLGKLSKIEKYVRNIDMKGEIEGTGLTLESANFKLKADIKKLELLDYKYHNITTNGTFANKKFDGDLSISDTNLNFVSSGLIDFTRDKPIIRVKSNLKKANLKELGLSKKQSIVSTKLDINILGTSLDQTIGSAKFDDLKISYDSNYLDLSTITIFSDLNENIRKLTIISPYLNFSMDGNYLLSKFTKDAYNLRDELLIGLRNNQEEITTYYTKKKTDTSHYKINYSLNILDVKPLLKLYNIDADVSDNTIVEGHFRQGTNTMFKLNSEIKYFRYATYELENVLFDINSSKFNNSSDVLAFILLESDKQNINNFKTEKLHTEAIWSDNKLELESYIKQRNNTNEASLFSEIDFKDKETHVKFNELKVQAYNQKWEISDSNSIIIKKGDYLFQNLIFGYNEQSISINGEFSKEPSKKAQINLQNFDLSILNPFSPQPLGGTTNLNLHISDIFEKQKILGNFSVSNFSVKENILGHLTGVLQWDKINENIYSGISLSNEGKIVEGSGLIYPFNTKNQLNFSVELFDANFQLIEPYFKAYASEFDGKIDGKINISGEFSYPVLTGEIFLKQASIKYDYTQTKYYINDKIHFEKDKVIFKNLVIKDIINNTGTINGNISHTSFTDYVNNLNFNFSNLKLLSTKGVDNSLYFGTVYGTGNMQISGPMDNVSIKADAKTEKNSQIFIPLNGYEGIEDKDFIKFITFNTKQKQQDTSQIDLSGINMDFNFEITQDAYLEIIFDSKAGDIIRGNGFGDLNLVIDTRGEFNMYGDYRINKGTYNFTLLNIINKEFIVTPGGTVSWKGNPYEGKLDIDARYQQRASLAPIVQDTTVWLSNPSLKSKKYPTDVILSLNGDLLHPQIDLDIEINNENLGVLQTSAARFESEIKNDEQELNRQVFSLIILKQFAQLSSFNNLNFGASAGKSMSELISNQLSYWMSQVDDNLEIDLDLGSLNTSDNNSYQLRLSYSFLDGRLRLSNQTDYDRNTDLSTVTGEITLEYMITKDGRLKLKMYNRTSQNSYSNDIDNSTYSTAGTSIQYTRGFNSLKELFSKKDKKQKK